MVKESKDVEEGKLAAILSYLLVGIIWYFADEKMKNNSFVKFHVKQGIVLIIASIVYSIVLGILFSLILFPLMFTGAGLGIIAIFRLLYYVPLVLSILGIINAANGKEKELPIIGHFAKKFSF